LRRQKPMRGPNPWNQTQNQNWRLSLSLTLNPKKRLRQLRLNQ